MYSNLGLSTPNNWIGPETKIEYTLPSTASVRLQVFNTHGDRVTILIDQVQGAGVHSAAWHSCDDAGQPVPSGVYMYQLTTGHWSLTKKYCWCIVGLSMGIDFFIDDEKKVDDVLGFIFDRL